MFTQQDDQPLFLPPHPPPSSLQGYWELGERALTQLAIKVAPCSIRCLHAQLRAGEGTRATWCHAEVPENQDCFVKCEDTADGELHRSSFRARHLHMINTGMFSLFFFWMYKSTSCIFEMDISTLTPLISVYYHLEDQSQSMSRSWVFESRSDMKEQTWLKTVAVVHIHYKTCTAQINFQSFHLFKSLVVSQYLKLQMSKEKKILKIWDMNVGLNDGLDCAKQSISASG